MNKTRQFLAVLKKNFILQTRGRKSLLGLGGWAGLILQLLLPVAFFFVMYLPKYYIKPTRHGETMGPTPVLLESRSWATPYDGPATLRSHGGRARLLLAPDSPSVRGLAGLLARGLACPRDPALRICPVWNLPTNFHCLFMPTPAPSPAAAPDGNSTADGAAAATGGGGSGSDGGERRGGGRAAGPASPLAQPLAARASGEAAGDGGGSGVDGGAQGLSEATSRRRLAEAEDEAREEASLAAAQELAGQAGLAGLAADPCSDHATCLATPACWAHVLGDQIRLIASLEEGRRLVTDDPDDFDALVAFPLEPEAAAAQPPLAARLPTPADPSLPLLRAVVGMNHTDVPPTKLLLDLFEVVPTLGNGLSLYRRYWFQANLQLALQRALIGLHVAANAPPPPPQPPPSAPPSEPAGGSYDAVRGGLSDASADLFDRAVPANVAVSYKAFPWPAVTEDLGAASAAIFFNLLLVYAFLPPTRAVVADIVREKELRLREGMRVLGLSEPAYWASWGLTHWTLLALSGALCAVAGTYPFASSSPWLMLAFFWLYGAALVSYSYAMSTMFSSSRVAGTASQLLYALSMLPGFLAPAIYQYGGWAWYAACLLPPSAASLFAAALVNWEKVAEGITPHTLWVPISSANSFSAGSVLLLMAADVALFAGLAWYLDKHQTPFTPRPGPAHAGPLLPSAGGEDGEEDGGGGGGGGDAEAADAAPAVETRGLVRVFRTTSGAPKTAVDHLDMRIERGRITALLGHNGAGKTTTIHILTGMLQPTAGSATVNGFDVVTQMDQVRSSLGICPQYDILWPSLTVDEHLRLYGAIKGYGGGELAEVSARAAASVGLSAKLSSAAGELSGGQRRKLSVAIAFMGDPAVVFLDEPTSGMDPYSRRFTWDVIRRHRSSSAIVLTTHSMEEADLLGDRVLILARGRLAAAGSGLELKVAAHGVGYNLTLVMDPAALAQPATSRSASQELPASPQRRKGDDRAGGSDSGEPRPAAPRSPTTDATNGDSPSADAAVAATPHTTRADGGGGAAADGDVPAAAAAVLSLVRDHVPSAQLLSCAGSELVVRLPREAGAAFPGLLRALDGPVGRQELGVASWGLSLTTLEEVFLAITATAEEQAAAEAEAAAALAASTSTSGPSLPAASATPAAAPPPPPSLAPPPPPLGGAALAAQQLRALLAKRLLCARRDRLAVLTQLAVPLALVGLALWVSALQVRDPGQPSLELTRGSVLMGRPLAFSAAPAARNASEGCTAAGGGSGGGTGGDCLAAFLSGHPAAAALGGPGVVDSGATALFTGDPRMRPTTLEAYLLGRWYGGGGPLYDAIHLASLPPPAALAAGAAGGPAASAAAPALSLVLATNQSAVHALPAALSEAMSAALSYISAGLPSPAAAASGASNVRRLATSAAAAAAAPPRGFSFASWPLPTLVSEPVVRVQRDAAGLMLVLCLVLASSVLSASYVVFLVREQDSGSKHLQLVAGAPAAAYWAANYLADMAAFAVSGGAILGLIAAYRLPQFGGRRLAAAAGLLAGFGPAGLSLTYAAHFLFKDEMRALQRLNTAYFLSGYLGFLVTWVADLIALLIPRPAGLRAWNDAAKAALRTASPHYCFAKGMYDVQATYDPILPFGPRRQPFDWDVFGSPMAHMAVQTVLYGGFAVLYDTGFAIAVHARLQDAAAAAAAWLRAAWRRSRRRLRAAAVRRRQHPAVAQTDGGLHPGGAAHTALELETPLLPPPEGPSPHPPAGAPADLEAGGVEAGGEEGPTDDEDDDVDVAAERVAVQEGRREGSQVLLAGVRKVYWPRGPFGPPLVAVRGLWLGVPAGECFGLLGVNGAGKTTTFRVLTGEVLPDAGDAAVGGHSVRTHLAAARRQLGYCPQFEALPGAMTGREVAAMYARLRGVPEPCVGPLVSRLLTRLGLGAAADTACGGYSGGMRRKLGVAVALVGDPRVTALDEPSTGMDPGARRGLWSCLRSEVLGAGRSVLLTSHSMEECEALCGRLTIMAAGRLRCLGSPQHLKGRFGGG
ncbi:hypothetical protein GPECTOR_7g1001 [Gonium pectorale]|uniref:ABC transporter domain-containing protein n=1 Tax=Gonium pectorale TaxID=33097 RepID=A0A150GTG4_GONPE|nr:hypothetical protein GPECTOR_7g1001 [Gonium pectorale]|eukprot:KXZ53111.1 hypothetical protein GPECTOR_7g1001 [Gonium pectorale]